MKIIPDVPDFSKLNIDMFDALVVPGGIKGARQFCSSESVLFTVRHMYNDNKIIGMICAGSLVAKMSRVHKGGKITGHPSVLEELTTDFDYVDERVVVDRNLVTSQGPGTAMLFSLMIVEVLAGREKRQEISAPMILSSSL
ncbi:Glutathione-independent glyoxalase DJ-1 [Neolecta irregularis DAH-3]|uniref:D-lactate dehydratase n=1 Tax=Neolecta irregularis (strain DAH-3) TaxID=1198029 RepID=A0A1U7LKN1_NEOID|nr:Glutathione-independent glyoxalase DJ-1 [Neolecta irregularis DAH-3]|eukprot:OLL23216.1 Glutathione-independent glyoxalase DJ-1 [Neolecta irregularis DAH-3]